MNVSEYRQALLSRGVRINPGLDANSIKQVAKKLKISINGNIIALYREFNGFSYQNMDGGSWIRVWPLEEVLQRNQKATPAQRLSFGDVLLESDELTADFANYLSAITLLETGEVIAESWNDFFSKLVLGELDII